MPGATLQEQAVRIAGAMAELGVQDLVLKRVGACTGLLTRQADLPGVLVAMPAAARLECASLGVVVEMTGGEIVWRGLDGGRAAEFEKALRD